MALRLQFIYKTSWLKSLLTNISNRSVWIFQSALASSRLCALAPLRQAVRSSFDLAALEHGGEHRELLQRWLA